MKRFESANSQNQKPSELKGPLPKNYRRARKAEPLQKSLNDGIEYVYHDLLSRFKKLYMTLPDSNDRTVVEVNNKKDLTDPDGMHTFITPHFHYHLRCSYADKYEVHYQFHECPFEEKIRAWFKRLNCSFYSFESTRTQDYPKFWQGVLDYQPKERVSVLDYIPK